MKLKFLILLIVLPQLVFAQDCDEGFVFNSSLNRCVLRNDVVDTQTEATECEGLTGQAYVDCFRNNADDRLRGMEDDGTVSNDKNLRMNQNAFAAPGAVGILCAYYLFSRKNGFSGCSATSVWLITGGAVATMVGEGIAQVTYKKRINDLIEEYTNNVEEAGGTDEEKRDILTKNQINAFDMLIKQELERKNAHKTRQITHWAATGMYAAATVASIVEWTQQGAWAQKCADKEEASDDGKTGGESQEAEKPVEDKPAENKPAEEQKTYEDERTHEEIMDEVAPKRGNYTPIKPKSNNFLVGIAPGIFGEYHYINNFSNQELLEIAIRKVSNAIFPSAYAAKDDTVRSDVQNWPLITALGTASASLALKPIRKVIQKGMSYPLTRTALSAALGTYSGFLADRAKDLMDASQKRADELEAIKAGFEAGGGATGNLLCSSDDRDDKKKPNCYCFLEDNTKHPGRLEDPACKLYVNKDIDGPTNYERNKYDGYTKLGNKGCINTDGTMNMGCDCKRFQCSSMSGKLKLGPLANMSDMRDMIKATKGFTDGKMSTDSLSSVGTDRMVARANKLKKQLAKNPKTAKDFKQAKQFEAKLKSRLSNIVNDAFKKGALSPSLASGGIQGASGKIKTPEDAIKAAKSAIAKNKETGGASGSSKAASMNDFDFGDDARGGIEMADDANDIMKKEFKVDDISGNIHGNIFKMINNRYQLSGMKRLFEEPKSEN